MPITVERNFKASSFLRWNELRPMIDPNRLRVFGADYYLAIGAYHDRLAGHGEKAPSSAIGRTVRGKRPNLSFRPLAGLLRLCWRSQEKLSCTVSALRWRVSDVLTAPSFLRAEL